MLEGEFPNRNHKAIEHAVSRLTFGTQKKKSIGTQIKSQPKRMAGLNRILGL
jgi:hypothetical protein